MLDGIPTKLVAPSALYVSWAYAWVALSTASITTSPELKYRLRDTGSPGLTGPLNCSTPLPAADG
ncbi:MAG: hypothetical protein JRN59_03345 [Nitrososphaerota archaeon]|nr:hypothetical protein [Nitrososphaerota archaeon]